MNVLIACEYSGIVREAFAARGHNAWSCDLLETEIAGQHFRGDVRTILVDKWDLMIAFPPCTYLTKAGARWFHGGGHARMQAREDAAEFFMTLVNAPIKRIAIENPVGVMSHRWRKPDQFVQPFMFGDDARKETCLWLKGLPLLVPTNIVPVTYVDIGVGKENRNSRTKRVSKWTYDMSLVPKDIRGHARSRTFQGIADAMATQWG